MQSHSLPLLEDVKHVLQEVIQHLDVILQLGSVIDRKIAGRREDVSEPHVGLVDEISDVD